MIFLQMILTKLRLSSAANAGVLWIEEVISAMSHAEISPKSVACLLLAVAGFATARFAPPLAGLSLSGQAVIERGDVMRLGTGMLALTLAVITLMLPSWAMLGLPLISR